MSAHQEYKWLIDLLTSLDVRIRSYSGRFMYGKQCLGIEFGGRGDKYDTEYELFGDLLEACLDATDDQDNLRELAEIVKGARSDSMGLGMVVYFPRVKWEEYMYGDDDDSDEESEDEDEDSEAAE